MVVGGPPWRSFQIWITKPCTLDTSQQTYRTEKHKAKSIITSGCLKSRIMVAISKTYFY
jgi:hypothetical protein